MIEETLEKYSSERTVSVVRVICGSVEIIDSEEKNFVINSCLKFVRCEN
jgi:hypothetical protein